MAFGVVIFPDCSSKFRAYLRIGDSATNHQLLVDQIHPRQILGIIGIGIGGGACGHTAHLFTGNFQGSGQNTLMGDTNRGRGLGHAVQIDEGRTITATTIRVAYNQSVGNRMAAILLKETVKCSLTQARDKDRFIMGNQFHIQKSTIQIKDNEHVDRGTRKTGQRGHRFCLEHKSGFCAPRIQQLPDAFVIQFLTQ